MGEAPVSEGDRAPPRVLVAGVGNVLHGDDGFGVRVVEALEGAPLPGRVTVRDVGIGGVHLVQELMAGYEVLVLVDVLDAPGAPGKVQLRRVEVPALDAFGDEERKGIVADTHVVVPAKALLLASAVGALPPRVFLVGCAAEAMELGEGLSPALERGVEDAAGIVRELLAELKREDPPGGTDGEGAPDDGRDVPPEVMEDGGADVRLRDEILQAMYWMKGEGLRTEVAPGELVRLMGAGMDPNRLEAAMESLARGGLLVPEAGGRFRLTDEGKREGGRRFADEFHGLTGQAHGECNDPDCDCHHDPDAALDCLASRGHR